MSTWLDRKPILSKPNHVTHPLLVISEIRTSTLIFYSILDMNLEFSHFYFDSLSFSHPSLVSVFLSTWAVSTVGYLQTNSSRTHTPEWPACGNTTHAGDYITRCMTEVWLWRLPAARQIREESTQHQLWFKVSCWSWRKNRAGICAQCEICAFLSYDRDEDRWSCTTEKPGWSPETAGQLL